MINPDWNFWAFAASAVYAIVAFFQLRAIAAQGDTTRQVLDATNRATDAANRNASAAFGNAESTKKAVEIAEQHRLIIADQSATLTQQASILAAQSATLENTLATNREIERTYMAMAYRDLFFLERKKMTAIRHGVDDDNPDTVDLVVELRNVGRTPGDIVGGWCGFLYQVASDHPRLTPAMDSSVKLTRLFMRPDQKPLDFALQITLTKSQIMFLRQGVPLDGATVVEGEDLPVTDLNCLWLVGEIHYRDRFGTYHWAGYGTRWDRRAWRFVYDPSTAALNYDRPMTEEEKRTRGYNN